MYSELKIGDVYEDMYRNIIQITEIHDYSTSNKPYTYKYRYIKKSIHTTPLFAFDEFTDDTYYYYNLERVPLLKAKLYE
jgi:hypothetical protein